MQLRLPSTLDLLQDYIAVIATFVTFDAIDMGCHHIIDKRRGHDESGA